MYKIPQSIHEWDTHINQYQLYFRLPANSYR